MICAPASGWVSTSFCNKTSAGGQLEHPSDVNSSTTTGTGGPAAAAPVDPTQARTSIAAPATPAPIAAVAFSNVHIVRILRLDWLSPAENPPDDDDEYEGNGHKRQSEQPERPIENRLRLHPCLELDRHTAHSIGQRLLPHQDVSAPDVALRVVKLDLARKVQAERDDLSAVPASSRGVSCAC